MDLLSVNVKNVYDESLVLARKSFPSPPNSCNLRDSVCRLSCLSSSFGVEDLRGFKIRLFRRRVDLFSSRHRSLMVRTKAKKNHDSSSADATETGCVLVATEKLNGVRMFERTVVLLLRSGARQREEGPFGIVINRPIHKKMGQIKSSNPDLAAAFSNCSLHFGGPLDAGVFLLKTGENAKLHGFREVVSGLCFGSRNCLDEAVGLVRKGVLKPQDFGFFLGYAGWQLDQLREEIELNCWHVAACSTNLLCGSSSSSEGLWEEILQLMGGHYSELSKKPKQGL